jgi:NADH-quinone oxidoreductase subunit L
MHHEQDMRKMGGLRRHIPFTFWMMVIGTLALTGFPFTAGYFSKDAIIEASFASQRAGAVYGFLCVVVAAALTSFYSWRLIFLTFFDAPHRHGAHTPEAQPAAEHDSNVHDEPQGDHGHEPPHESPPVMLVPLAVLAVGALVAGLAFRSVFAGSGYEGFWKGALYLASSNHILKDMEDVSAVVSSLPSIMMVVGFLIAYYMYIVDPQAAPRLARQHRILYEFLLNKWYFDEIYDFLFVRPAFWIGRLFWKGGDGRIIDGIGPDGVAARVIDITRGAVRLQTGYVYHYAFAMLIGVAAFLAWYFLGGVR